MPPHRLMARHLHIKAFRIGRPWVVQSALLVAGMVVPPWVVGRAPALDVQHRFAEQVMLKTGIQRIVDVVCRRARERGFVRPEDVRAVLVSAGMSENQWSEVVSLAGDMLSNKDGCFYYSPVAAANRRAQRRRRRLSRALRQLIRSYRSSVQHERRRQGRFDFVHPVQVDTEDGRTFTLISCNLSPSGIRLIGPNSLLGRKVCVTFPSTGGAMHRRFQVQIVWSSIVGEGLYENGGAFVDLVDTARDAAYAPAPAPAAMGIAHTAAPVVVGSAKYPRLR